MKLGTKTRYSARAMLDLALNYENGNSVVPVKEIAGRQNVSAKYLEHLLASLRAAGLVRSVRGAQGGHQLARPPGEINLREVYHVFEGADGFVECTTCAELCDRADGCVTCEMWTRLYDASMEILESTTLEDLARRARENQDTVAGV
jgi:Rrf2 family cysteine metabolism transcriptional repressor